MKTALKVFVVSFVGLFVVGLMLPSEEKGPEHHMVEVARRELTSLPACWNEVGFLFLKGEDDNTAVSRARGCLATWMEDGKLSSDFEAIGAEHVREINAAHLAFATRFQALDLDNLSRVEASLVYSDYAEQLEEIIARIPVQPLMEEN